MHALPHPAPARSRQPSADSAYASNNRASSSSSSSAAATLPVPASKNPVKASTALSRGLACRTCRTRKVRCDAVKPGCGACRKTATVQGRNPDEVACEYDTEDIHGSSSGSHGASNNAAAASTGSNARKRKAPSRATESTASGSGSDANKKQASGMTNKKVADLERTIAELENKLHKGSYLPGGPALSGIQNNAPDWNAYKLSVPALNPLFPPTAPPFAGSLPNQSDNMTSLPANHHHHQSLSYQAANGPSTLETPSSSSIPLSMLEATTERLPTMTAGNIFGTKPVPDYYGMKNFEWPGSHASLIGIPPSGTSVGIDNARGAGLGAISALQQRQEREQAALLNGANEGSLLQQHRKTSSSSLMTLGAQRTESPLALPLDSNARPSSRGFDGSSSNSADRLPSRSLSGNAEVLDPVVVPQQHQPFQYQQNGRLFIPPNGQTLEQAQQLYNGKPPSRPSSSGPAAQKQTSSSSSAQSQQQPPQPPKKSSWSPSAFSKPIDDPSPASFPFSFDPSSSFSSTSLYPATTPAWPPTLPSPKIIYNLCDIFFTKKFLGADLVNRTRFFKNLALPPGHREFPHTALIHAMCAVATKLVTNEEIIGLSSETYWKSEACPTDYHAAQAKAHIDNAIIRGEKLFSVAQAVILICFYSYTSARFVEVWLYCGLATRICSPLGLNHLESLLDDLPNKMFGFGNTHGGGTLRGQPIAVESGMEEESGLGEEILSPNRDRGMGYAPQTEEEKQEQAHTFWMAFTCDRLAAACTGWASSLAEDEISTLLPKPTVTPGPIQPITAEEIDQLSISSPTFFTSNSLPLVGAANLHYKSVVLLGRVCSFLRSAPWPVGADIIKGARQHQKGEAFTKATNRILTTPEFKKIDALIAAFRLSFPKEFKNVLRKDTNGAVETNLISAHVIPHASTILLHEAFCRSEDDISMQRCLTSARAILSIIYLLWGSSYDISLLQPFITFCWAVAGRTLVRELAFKQEAGDELGVATLTQEINVILAAMTAFADRSPLGLVVANSLRQLLQDPQSCHPRRNGGVTFADSCSSGKIATFGKYKDSTESNTSASMSSTSGPESTAGTTPTDPMQLSDISNNSTGLNATLSTPDGISPGFSGLLWELEQPGVELGQNANYRKMEGDLRSVLGPSYDDLLSMP